MPAPHTDRRPDVLEWATGNGWNYETTTFDNGQIIRDLFTKDDLVLRAVWLSTPFSPAMWARGLLERSRTVPLTVPRVSESKTRASLEAVLKGTWKGL